MSVSASVHILPDDDEPVVVFDDAVAVATLPSAGDAPSQPVPLPLLQRLVTYAQGRLQAGVGVEQFQACGLAVPAFVELYAAGFMPVDYHLALAPAEAELLAGHDLAGCCVLPAYDHHGVIVDLLCWHLGATATFVGGLQPDPTGILAPAIRTIAPELTVDGNIQEVSRNCAAGERHIHLLRPDMGVQIQMQELQARGVKTIRVAAAQSAAAEIRSAGAAIGLRVVDVNVDGELGADRGGDWQLVTIDRDHHKAVFQSGDLTVAVATPWQGSTRLRVDARRSDGRNQGDTCDLAVPRQVEAFAQLAARKLQTTAAGFMRLLGPGFLDRLRALEQGNATPVATPPAVIAAQVEADLADPTLVERFVADAGILGWVGDHQAKILALLTLAGLNLEHPPWLLLRGPAAISLPIVGMLADLLRPERRLHLRRAVESSLPNQGPDGFRQRLLVVDDLAALRPATLTTLRVLQARGGVAVPVATRDAENGRMVSRLTEARGPAGMLAAAEDETDGDDLGVVVRLDDSAEQTARAMVAAQQAFQGGVDLVAQARVRGRWQAILAALPRMPVRIPAADRIVFPARHPRHRVEQAHFFALVAASALLHHRQRQQIDGCLHATDADIACVITATQGILGRIDDGLSDRARDLVKLCAGQADPGLGWLKT